MQPHISDGGPSHSSPPLGAEAWRTGLPGPHAITPAFPSNRPATHLLWGTGVLWGGVGVQPLLYCLLRKKWHPSFSSLFSFSYNVSKLLLLLFTSLPWFYTGQYDSVLTFGIPWRKIREKEKEREREKAGDREHPTEMLLCTCAVKDPCSDRTRPSCASYCVSVVGTVDGLQLPRSILSTTVEQILLPLAHHLPYYPWGPSCRKVRDAGSWGVTHSLDRPPRLKSDGVFQLQRIEYSARKQRECRGKNCAPRKVWASQRWQGQAMKSSKSNTNKNKNVFKHVLYDRDDFWCSDKFLESSLLYEIAVNLHLVLQFGVVEMNLFTHM